MVRKLIKKWIKIRKNFAYKQKEQDKIADFLVTEALANYHLIKYFNAEKIELAKYQAILDVIWIYYLT